MLGEYSSSCRLINHMCKLFDLLILSIMVCCKTEKMLVFIYLWLWLWLSSISSSGIHVKAENDSLKPGDTLNATSQLYSKNGKYYITFSRTYNDESTYLMIISAANEVVWMSVRNQPVDPTSAVLSLNHSGVLKIESPNVKPIILYSSPNKANATNNIVATLLDTGNFEVQQLHPNGTKSSVLWQSFDYPVDTLIPEMKLGVNRKTGHNWSLVSCLTFYLSTPGAFSLEWEPVARELIIKRRGKVCWKSGKLRNNRTFENIPEEVQRNYQYRIVSNSDEDSFSFKTITLNNKTSQAWILFENGHLGNDKVDIARADMCYGYNNSNGCQRWEDIPTCRNPGDVFKKKIGSPNYENATYEPNTGYGITDCMAICWSNCNCTAFRKFYRNGTGCIIFQWDSTEDYAFDNNGESFYMLINTAPHKSTKKWMWVSAVIAAALLIISLSILCLALKKRKYGFKEKKSERKDTKMLDLATPSGSPSIKDFEDGLKKGHDIKILNYTSILEATNDFSPQNKLGQGGFRPVYKVS